MIARSAWALFGVLWIAACQPSVAPGANCMRSSECVAPLVCALGRCRAACAQSRDCPTLARCLVEPSTSTSVCSLTQVDDCASHDCPLHFTCQNGACVNVCSDIARCPDGRCDANGCTPVIGDAGSPSDASLDAPIRTTWTIAIADDTDDGQLGAPGAAAFVNGENNDERDYTGHWSGSPTWAFARFALPAALPSGAHVTDARLHLTGVTSAGLLFPGNMLALVAEDSADALAVTSSDDSPGSTNGRVGTSAMVPWAVLDFAIGPDVSPDLSPIVQQLVDRHGGLAAGAHVTLWISGTGYAQDGEVAFQDTAPGIAGPSLTLVWSR